jgi:hypothetical protein
MAKFIDQVNEEVLVLEKRIVLLKQIIETYSDSALAEVARLPKKAGGKARTCGKCGKEGHRADHCPTAEQPKSSVEKFSGTTEQLREEVQSRKADGMSSAEIAKELGLSLYMINKVW